MENRTFLNFIEGNIFTLNIQELPLSQKHEFKHVGFSSMNYGSWLVARVLHKIVKLVAVW